ncbi:MAG TPA: DinB family protein [Blastocatellia bacterium]
MQNVIEEFRRTISESYDQLAKLSDAESAHPLSEGKWSRKELIGHLIDSASNNHQRFVRAQLAESHSFPSYAQASWVALQGYKDEPWEDLTLLWKSYNQHLLHVVSCMPEDKLGVSCTLGNGEPVTLGFIVQDYVDHLKHHLSQILGEQ